MARIVLVADDSPTIQKRAMGILKGEGFEVETVSNGVAAIKRLAVLHPVAILADVSMPGRDGYEVCEYVKKSPGLAHVPVLLVASDMEPYDSARGANVGADGIIKKPFEARELIAIVVKFAEQFEAATISLPAEPAAPPPEPEPKVAPEPISEAADSAPTVVQHVEQEFAAHAGGVAFAEPMGDEPSAFSFEPHPNDTGAQFGALPTIAANSSEPDFEFPPAPAVGFNLAGEVPLVSDPHAAHPSPLVAEELPSFFKGVEPAHPEPVFIEEEPALPPQLTNPFAAHDGPVMVWAKESASATPEHEPAGEFAMEPKFTTDENVASSESPHDHPHDHNHEHPHIHPVSATSLDSFSLDDAAAGQVRFASEVPEVVYAEPMEEAAALASTPSEPELEVMSSKSTGSEPAPEVVYADAAELETALKEPPSESSSPEAVGEARSVEDSAPVATPETVREESAAHETAPEVVYADEAVAPEPTPEAAKVESPSVEPASEAVHTDATPTEPAPEAIHAETAPEESALGEVRAEAAAAEPALEEVDAEAPPAEPALEATHTEAAPVEPAPEPAHSETHLPDVAAVAAGIASLGAAAELIHAEFAHHDAPPEVIHQESAPAESMPEAIHSQETAPESTSQTTKPEPAAEPTPPKPAVDADALYSIVLKVVMKMAPPMLTADAVEQIAKHLAKEIGEELSIESHKPQV